MDRWLRRSPLYRYYSSSLSCTEACSTSHVWVARAISFDTVRQHAILCKYSCFRARRRHLQAIFMILSKEKASQAQFTWYHQNLVQHDEFPCASAPRKVICLTRQVACSKILSISMAGQRGAMIWQRNPENINNDNPFILEMFRSIAVPISPALVVLFESKLYRSLLYESFLFELKLYRACSKRHIPIPYMSLHAR